MTTRIQKIINDARYKLGDTEKSRWSDLRLLRLVDAAQKDFVEQTQILKGTLNLLLKEQVAIYDLPENLWYIERAAFDNLPLALKTHDEMDDFTMSLGVNNNNQGSEATYWQKDFLDSVRFKWDDDTGRQPLALIYDMRDMDTIRVYPIPEGLSDTVYPFVSTPPVEFVGDELMGVVVDMEDYTFNSPFGVVVGLYDPAIEQEHFVSPYGGVTGIAESSANVRIWYIRKAKDLVSEFDLLELPSVYDDALMHYVVGHAYDDDLDTRSEAKSQKALANYDRKLQVAKTAARRDHVKSSSTGKATYRGPFNA